MVFTKWIHLAQVRVCELFSSHVISVSYGSTQIDSKVRQNLRVRVDMRTDTIAPLESLIRPRTSRAEGSMEIIDKRSDFGDFVSY